jgi:hypothetical protein
VFYHACNDACFSGENAEKHSSLNQYFFHADITYNNVSLAEITMDGAEAGSVDAT